MNKSLQINLLNYKTNTTPRRRSSFLFLSIVIIFLVIPLTGCFDLQKVDNAIEQLKKANQNFGEIIKILNDLKDNLDEGQYKDQVVKIINSAGGVADISAACAGDFIRERAINDLKNLRHSILKENLEDRIPILCNGGDPQIDFKSSSNSTIQIVGWNLDAAQNDPDRYKVVIKNKQESDRNVESDYVTFQGQHAVKINVSSSGIKFKYYDTKLVFQGYDPLFEIPIINTDPPIPPEYFTELNILSTQYRDEKDANIKARFTILSGTNQITSFEIGKTIKWADNITVKILIQKDNPSNWLGFMGYCEKYGFPQCITDNRNRAAASSEYSKCNCHYVITAPELPQLIKGSGMKITFIVEELEDNSGWKGHFVIRGKTNKNNNVTLLTENFALGDSDSHIFQKEFNW